ncbi:MAG: sigma-70 family RNA polymerase sigma factor [Acidimicrobiales bacterium]
MGDENEEEFDVFVTRVQPQLERALAGHLPAPMVGDAVAEALAYAWEHRDRVLPMTNPAGYLYRVAQSRSRRRRQGLLPWTSDDAIPDIEPGLPAALARLSPKQSQAIWLVHAAGMTHVEAGEAMGISASTVANHLERGMIRLRTELGVDR